VIVVGFTPSADTSDKLNFKRMCMLELGIEPEIAFTRRLSDGRSGVWLLMVGLQSEQDVLSLLSRTKDIMTVQW